MMNDGLTDFSLLDLDDEPTVQAPAKLFTPIVPVLIKPAAAPAPVAAAPTFPAPVQRTPHGVVMSERASRIYTYINANGVHMTPFSTDGTVGAALPRLQKMRETLASYPANAQIADMIVDLDAIMGRTSANRVTAEGVEGLAQTPTEERSASLVAVESATEAAGAVTYWQLHGQIDAAALKAAWEVEGLEAKHCPSAPSPKVSLRRAVKSVCNREIFHTEHPEGGWALVTEKRAANKLDYEVGMRLRLSPDETTILGTPAEGQDLNEARVLGNAVRAAFDNTRSHLDATDVSTVLVWLVGGQLKGVPLRDSGGVYFVPKESVETLRKIKRALAAATSCVVHEIPAMKSVEFVAAVYDAVRREAEAELAALEAELAVDFVTTKGMNAKAKRFEDVQQKLASYEKLLNKPMGDLASKLKAVKSILDEAKSRFNQLEV